MAKWPVYRPFSEISSDGDYQGNFLSPNLLPRFGSAPVGKFFPGEVLDHHSAKEAQFPLNKGRETREEARKRIFGR